jgi:eukaryotic-like serine/threonine-protein kinase
LAEKEIAGLPEGHDQQAECRVYFLNEAQWLSSLHHERIVRGLGTLRLGEETLILMEFIDGIDLRSWMDDHRPPRRFDHFYRIAMSCAEGLQYLHSQGLIHRDIAPRNIMVENDLRAKVIDLQFATPDGSNRAAGSEQSALPMSYGIGHWAFSAPEVMDGLDAKYDHRADIYSLGAVLIELLVGRPPRRRSPIECRPDVSRTLSDLLWAMVDEQPENRPTWPEISRSIDASNLRDGE